MSRWKEVGGFDVTRLIDGCKVDSVQTVEEYDGSECGVRFQFNREGADGYNRGKTGRFWFEVGTDKRSGKPYMQWRED